MTRFHRKPADVNRHWDFDDGCDRNRAPKEPTVADAAESSPIVSTPKPAKPTERSATPRSVVRTSVGVGERVRNLLHGGNGGHSTTRAAAADERAATEKPASAAPSSTGNNSSAKNATGG
jgi:hypothetical protein